jgi:hypothetical protein
MPFLSFTSKQAMDTTNIPPSNSSSSPPSIPLPPDIQKKGFFSKDDKKEEMKKKEDWASTLTLDKIEYNSNLTDIVSIAGVPLKKFVGKMLLKFLRAIIFHAQRTDFKRALHSAPDQPCQEQTSQRSNCPINSWKEEE